MTETRASLREPLLAFAIATALAASFAALGTVVPLVREYLHVLIAIVFFQTPVVAARRAGGTSTIARSGCAWIRSRSTWRSSARPC